MNRFKRLTRIEPQDAVVFVADTLENATDALKGVTQRARDALKGIPEETRGAKPDGTTRYLRPRPGAARMYPETDIPPIQLNEEYLEKLRTRLPELPEKRLKRLMEEYNINQKLSRQILDSEYSTLFEVIVQETEVSATVVAATLTETLKALKRDGIEVEKVTDGQIKEIFRLLSSGETVKEAIPEIVGWLSKHERAPVKDAIESLGLKMISTEELELMIENLLREHRGLVEKRGKGAFGALMGVAMEKIRGHAKAELVSKILKRRLDKLLE
jgi:glutamyl-tRNA(Gln) amidotransferase subunit E